MWIMGFSVGLALSICAFYAGVIVGTKLIRQEAVEAGAGQWVADQKSGTTKFEFNKKSEHP